jgi:molybdopterin-guanine dinucleotide biosynthesis protein B
VAATRLVSIIGRKNAGKTTLLVALGAELARRGFRVMTIKHGTHPADTDQRGKDTWRHWHEGRAERVLMEGPGQRVLWERTEREEDPVALARRYLNGADIVLVEGFKRAPLPKIEVYRLAAGPDPLFDPRVHDPAEWVAIVTDNPGYRPEAPFPVFRFSDTAWLVTLASLAWDRAKILAP